MQLRNENGETSTEKAFFQYQKWLWEQYLTYLDKCIQSLSDTDANTQVLAFRSLMKCVSLEGKINGDEHTFGVHTYARILRALIIHDRPSKELKRTFENEFLLVFSDIQYHTVSGVGNAI